MGILQVLAEVLDRAADLFTSGARRHALMDLHVTHQRHPMLVLPEANVALVWVST